MFSTKICRYKSLHTHWNKSYKKSNRMKIKNCENNIFIQVKEKLAKKHTNIKGYFPQNLFELKHFFSNLHALSEKGDYECDPNRLLC